MGACEITNEQYAAFDPAHDSAYISEFKKDQGNRGQPVNQTKQPVLRISWEEAMAFCDWLSKKTGRKFTLPTEAQWEYACRAGTTTALNYGEIGANFGKFANLADQRVLAICRGQPLWIPCIETVNDGASVTTNVQQYPPNAWGLQSMHGNVTEWTLTTYKPYPYTAADGRDKGVADGDKVVRGGSFYDRPERARSAFRLAYRPYQRVFNVGFRVVCVATPDAQTSVQPGGTPGPQVSEVKVAK
jgi:formylglycine-generating enzyme required for sulfatase activity